jgi:outer membrane lipoprotein carrier protein
MKPFKNNFLFFIFYFLFFALSTTVFAQQDPAAKAALEKSVALMRTSAVKVAFSTTIEASSGKKNTVSGSLTMMGNKYRLTMSGSEVYFNGTTQWVYAPDNNEVTISTISAKDRKRMNPLSILSQYSGKDTKINFSRDAKAPVGQIAIDIFPISKSANEFRILVKLNKRTNIPQSLQLFNRDGTRTTIIVKYFQKTSENNKIFVFDIKSHPKISVNDLR